MFIFAESDELGDNFTIQPNEASRSDLSVVHTKNYLRRIRWSCHLAVILENPLLTFLPHFLVDRHVLKPMRHLLHFDLYYREIHRYQTGGTILAARIALEKGWAINIGGSNYLIEDLIFYANSVLLGGGFHHASRREGGGFCVYADISLALQFLFLSQRITKAIIVDLDAHQVQIKYAIVKINTIK